MDKAKLYAPVARACLAALKNSHQVSAEHQADTVFAAIDQAFTQQYSLLLEELAERDARLTAICALVEGQHTLAEAQAIAKPNNVQH